MKKTNDIKDICWVLIWASFISFRRREYQRITSWQIKRNIGWEIQHLMYLLCVVTYTCITSVTDLTWCRFIQYKVAAGHWSIRFSLKLTVFSCRNSLLLRSTLKSVIGYEHSFHQYKFYTVKELNYKSLLVVSVAFIYSYIHFEVQSKE